MKYWITTIAMSILALQAWSQGSNLPLGNPAYHILDRLEIKTGMPAPFHSALKYYTRGAATLYALQLDTADLALSRLDRQDLHYIFLDNNEWLGQTKYPTRLTGPRERVHPDSTLTQVEAGLASEYFTYSKKPILGIFYRTPANLLEVNEKFFHLRVNPVLDFKLGAARNDEQPIFFNLRGVELRGGIDDRIYFYSNILETQARFPNYVRDYWDKFGAIPGAGFVKSYQSSLFDIEDGKDFLNGQGYLGFNISRHVGLQFGYGRNFVGDGYRSMFLSDFSNNYLYLKLNWKVWKLHLQNIFAELSIGSANIAPDNTLVGKKYMAAHHLSIDILPNLNVGIFESVIFDRPNQFELNYLNPVILYRTVEQALGSPDNVAIGLNAQWSFLRHFQLYGQLIFDEFKFRELIAEDRGWWANKYGVQAGFKYIDALGVDHLDLQAEYNTARPYTYSHSDSISNYSHYNQALAHPLGANFREYIFMARYQPLHRLVVEGRLIRATYGEDSEKTNWGMNILLPNSRREQDYDNETGQGISTTTTILGLDLSYMLAHNIFIDLHYFYRQKDSALPELDLDTQYFSGGVRINIGKQRMDF